VPKVGVLRTGRLITRGEVLVPVAVAARPRYRFEPAAFFAGALSR
jgi:hypothetical protein